MTLQGQVQAVLAAKAVTSKVRFHAVTVGLHLGCDSTLSAQTCFPLCGLCILCIFAFPGKSHRHGNMYIAAGQTLRGRRFLLSTKSKSCTARGAHLEPAAPCTLCTLLMHHFVSISQPCIPTGASFHCTRRMSFLHGILHAGMTNPMGSPLHCGRWRGVKGVHGLFLVGG